MPLAQLHLGAGGPVAPDDAVMALGARAARAGQVLREGRRLRCIGSRQRRGVVVLAAGRDVQPDLEALRGERGRLFASSSA